MMALAARCGSGLAALALAWTLGCGPQPGPATRVRMQLSLPERVQCAAPPSNIRAQAWVSGMNSPYDLTVSSSGSVSGELEGVTARIDRTVTLDYFLSDDLVNPPAGVPDPYRLLLAQAVTEVALTNPSSDRVEVVFGDGDFVAAGDCRDMTNYNEETGESARTVDHFVVGAPPCDVDDDGISNVEELCAAPATDPYS